MSSTFTGNLGWITIIPPIIAIIVALLSKEVTLSLMLGIFSGALAFSKGNIIKTVITVFEAMANKIGDNANILVFLGLTGILVTLITKAGGSVAYGNWASKRIKTRKGALSATFTLGCMIFIDDYFNCLTVGNVMRPITDNHKISRVKLAYLLDSTAAPICILAPMSSWGASISTYLQNSNVGNGMATFLELIPYNLYAIFTIIMVIFVFSFDLRFSKMKQFEDEAIKNGVLSQAPDKGKDEEKPINRNVKGKVYDLIIPILTMISVTVIMMIYTGNGFSGNSTIVDSFGKADSSLSLVVGSFCATISSLLLYIPRKIISLKEFTASISEGIQTMVPSFIILILAWTISEICSISYLNTGGFISTIVRNSKFPTYILPVIIFMVSGFLGFATGTSWGTMALLIPVCAAICSSPDTQTLLFPALGAVLAGAVFGDHISPISDTTILSSAGAKCNHLDHVSTQITYSSIVAFSCCIGFLLMGITENIYISFIVSLLALLTILCVIKYFTTKKQGEKMNV